MAIIMKKMIISLEILLPYKLTYSDADSLQ